MPGTAFLLEDLGFYLLWVGLTLYLSSVAFRYRIPWMIEFFFLLGIMSILAEHIIMFIVHYSSPNLVYLFKAGFSVMVASIIAWFMAYREEKLLNRRLKLSLSSHATSIGTVLLLELTMASGGGFSLVSLERWVLGLTTVGVTVWLVWHIFVPKIFLLYLKGVKGAEVVMLDSICREELPNSFMELLSRSFMLVLMVFSIMVLGIQVFAPSFDLSRMENLILLARHSLILEVLIGVWGPPVYWMFDTLNLRFYNFVEGIVEKKHPIEALDNMIDAFALVGFLLALRDVTISITPLAEDLATYISLATFNLFLLIFYFVAVTVPPALIATTVYYKYSFDHQARYILDVVKPKRFRKMMLE